MKSYVRRAFDYTLVRLYLGGFQIKHPIKSLMEITYLVIKGRLPREKSIQLLFKAWLECTVQYIIFTFFAFHISAEIEVVLHSSSCGENRA